MSNSPKVWSKFSATDKNGDTFNFRIVDLPKDRYDDYTELFINAFAKEERSFIASGVSRNADALKEFRQMILDKRNDKTTQAVICCIDYGDDKIHDIIGASVMMLATREEVAPKMLPAKIITEPLKKRYEIFSGMLDTYDSIQAFNQDRYFIDRGLFVHAGYRGLGIAQELLRVRRLICKENGIAMHGAWMTSYGTQKAAERDGWETVCEIQYDEYDKKCGVTFKGGPPTCKFMVARISL